MIDEVRYKFYKNPESPDILSMNSDGTYTGYAWRMLQSEESGTSRPWGLDGGWVSIESKISKHYHHHNNKVSWSQADVILLDVASGVQVAETSIDVYRDSENKYVPVAAGMGGLAEQEASVTDSNNYLTNIKETDVLVALTTAKLKSIDWNIPIFPNPHTLGKEWTKGDISEIEARKVLETINNSLSGIRAGDTETKAYQETKHTLEPFGHNTDGKQATYVLQATPEAGAKSEIQASDNNVDISVPFFPIKVTESQFRKEPSTPLDHASFTMDVQIGSSQYSGFINPGRWGGEPCDMGNIYYNPKTCKIHIDPCFRPVASIDEDSTNTQQINPDWSVAVAHTNITPDYVVLRSNQYATAFGFSVLK